MARQTEQVELEDCDCSEETKLAIRINYDGKFWWIPKSLIHDDSEVYKKGTSGTLVIPEWFAAKEGLI